MGSGIFPNGDFARIKRGQYISRNGFFSLEYENRSIQLPIPTYDRPKIKNASGIYSDKNGIVIDFNGDGVEGYNFFVSSSGSKGDGTVRDEKERNWDWDADWETAATVDDGVWYTESFIPWTVASMKSQSGEIRKNQVKIRNHQEKSGNVRKNQKMSAIIVCVF